MVMESGLHELSGMINALRYDDHYSDQNIFSAVGLGQSQPFLGYDGFVASSLGTVPSSNSTSTVFSSITEGESQEDSEIFSDIALSYISRMLMEEDIDEKVSSYQQEAALRAAEKPFYDILGQKYPPSPIDQVFCGQKNLRSSDNGSCDQHGSLNGTSSSHSEAVDNGSPSEFTDSRRMYLSSPSFSSSSSVRNASDPFEESFTNITRAPSLLLGSFPAWHFKRGMDEARRFLPINNKLMVDLKPNGSSSTEGSKDESTSPSIKAKVEEKDLLFNGSRGRKNPNNEELDMVEGRSNKQSAVSTELEGVRSDALDMVLLFPGDKCSQKIYDLREAMQNDLNKGSQIGQTKASIGGKARGKKQPKKDVVDLRTILIHCAQAVAADDRRTANELLRQIRQHASSTGDGSQRLAHWFADGLEARLAGTGSQIYKTLVAKRTTASDILKAYHLYLAACPFKKISHFFSNQTILNVAEKASRIHIIDFGIYFGFQWPYLIQRLSTREGGPPMLRITGIDVAQPGFRPTERIEETGRRLADYAKSFNVPFEYQAITSKWETIRAEDLNIMSDEVVIVNCLYRFRNLVDETVVVDSPRNRVLNTIRRMNPDVFIHGIVNGSYSAPFFVTRFREALFHYSSLFDMLETTVPRENEQRLLIERDLFGREALNVIACEGSERVERPETYKQWQVRNLRAGFVQLPIDAGIMKKAKDKVRTCYHKDFVIDEDNRWLLQGWKGRIVYAISTWMPNKT